jgi:hypothetical protein
VALTEQGTLEAFQAVAVDDVKGGHRHTAIMLCHKRKSKGADVDLYARPVDGRRTYFAKRDSA